MTESITEAMEINDSAVYHETSAGVEFLSNVDQCHRDKGGSMVFTIPWSKIRSALKKKDKKFLEAK